MTPEELATTLRHLAGHLHHLQQELYDAPLHAPRYSQTDSHKSHGGPKAPCNIANLDYLRDTGADDIIKGWATNLATDTPAHGLPHGQPLATWCAWLHRNLHHLETVPWSQEATTELQELEATLRHHIHPQDPNFQIEHRQTARSICNRLTQMGHHITPATLRQWHKRGKITAVELSNGHNGYLLTEVLDNI